MVSDNVENSSKVRESEEKCQTIFAYALDGIALIDSGSGDISDCNPEFERQSGRRLDDLKKMKIWEIRPPEKIDEAKAKFFDIVKRGSGGSQELDFQRPDGKTTPIEFVSNLVKINEKHYILSMTRDITKRKKAEDEILCRSEGLAALLKVSHDLAFTLDMGTVMQTATDSITEFIGLKSAAIYLIEEDSLYLWATTPPLDPQMPDTFRKAPLSDHPHIRESISTGKPVSPA